MSVGNCKGHANGLHISNHNNNGNAVSLSPLVINAGHTPTRGGQRRSIGLVDLPLASPRTGARPGGEIPMQLLESGEFETGTITITADPPRRKKKNRGKRFVCQNCSKGFTQKGGLLNHARIHTGEKPFKCGECAKAFTQKCNLVRHLRVHTGEKPFECAHCQRRFNRKWGLVVHLRTHIREQTRGGRQLNVYDITEKNVQLYNNRDQFPSVGGSGSSLSFGSGN
jgi:hypothetical protein